MSEANLAAMRVDLDQPSTYAAVDGSGMLEHLGALPSQLADAWALAQAFEPADALGHATAIVVAGMGGSAIGADLVRAYASDLLHVPLVVWRDYGLPAWAGRRTLVVVSSYSGGTEETLSAIDRALRMRAPLVGITTGGAVAERLERAGCGVLRFDYPAQPRAAVGYSLGLVLGLLTRLGYLPDQAAAVATAGAAAREASDRFGSAEPAAANAAKQLAVALHDRVVVVHGGGFLAPVARRWKGQLNENAKQWAFAEELPELNHNAVMGFPYPMAAGRVHVVQLDSALLSERMRLRTRVTGELLARAAVPATRVEAWGEGRLAHLLSALAWGDWTSYYAALLNGIDPTGIAAIDYLKARLAEAE